MLKRNHSDAHVRMTPATLKKNKSFQDAVNFGVTTARATGKSSQEGIIHVEICQRQNGEVQYRIGEHEGIVTRRLAQVHLPNMKRGIVSATAIRSIKHIIEQTFVVTPSLVWVHVGTTATTEEGEPETALYLFAPRSEKIQQLKITNCESQYDASQRAEYKIRSIVAEPLKQAVIMAE